MKKLFSKFDLFPALPTLRVRGEPEVINLCGSIFSMIIVAVFIYLFVSSLIATVSLQAITATQMIQIKDNSKQKIENFTIGIGLQWNYFNAFRNIFQLRAFKVNKDIQYQQLEVIPCTRQIWNKFSDDKYKVLNLDTFTCVKKDNISIYGQNGGIDFNLLFINLTLCNNSTSPVTCASTQEIDFFFNNYMVYGRFMACAIVILNTGINPTNINPITYTSYEKTLWMLFNRQQNVMIQIYLGTYEINTDTSFLPYQQQEKKTGYFVSQCITTSIVNTKSLPIFLQAFIFSSSNHRVINRTYGKIDSVLSYVGGLYGIIIGFFSFFILSYNQYKYELRVSEGAFTFKNSHLAQEDGLNFLKYLKYVFFDWVKTLFCYEIKWQDCKAIDEARQEAIQQIDVKHLLKRISHLEKVMSVFVNPQGETVMYMAESNSLQQAKRKRNIVQYCNKFTQNNKAMTISALQQLQAIASSFLFGFGNTSSNSQPFIKNLSSINSGLNFQNSQQQINLPQNKQTIKASLDIMQQYLKKYVQKFNITKQDFDLTESDLQAEEELCSAFFHLDEQHRKMLIKKIPLGILFRMKICKQKPKEQDLNQIKPLQKNTIDQNSSKLTTSIFLAPLRKGNRKRIGDLGDVDMVPENGLQ